MSKEVNSRAGVAFHDAKAQAWEGLYRSRGFRMRRRVISGFLQPHVGTGDRWLDAGCGTGTLSRDLAVAGGEVVGVDASSAMVEMAMKLLHESNDRLGCRFEKVESIEHLPFGDASFDGVLCSSVIEYVDDPAMAVAELGRVLKPGGRLLVTVPNSQAWTRKLERVAHQITKRCTDRPWPRYLNHSRWHFDRGSLSMLLHEAGLGTQSFEFFGPLMPEPINRFPALGMLMACLATKID